MTDLPLVGYDSNLLAVDSPDEVSAVNTPVQARTRTRSVTARSRLDASSDGSHNDRLVIVDIHAPPSQQDNISHQNEVGSDSILRLLRSPVTPQFDDLRNASVSTQFSVPIDIIENDQSYEDDDLRTIVHNSPNLDLSGSEEHSHGISDTAGELVNLILNLEMATEAPEAAKMCKRSMTINSTTYTEEYVDLDLDDVPNSEIKEMIAKAKTMKDELLSALTDAEGISELIISPDLKEKAAEARSGLLAFIKVGNKRMKSTEIVQTPPPSGNTSISTVSMSRTKSIRVERYTDITVGEMRELIDQLDRLAVEQPGSQIEFRNLQDRVKSTQKELSVIKKTATELINNAIDCDMVEECQKMEDTLRQLERKEIHLEKEIQVYKDDYGIVGDGLSKNNDLKYPTFSGDETDKLDYYSFREDWDACVAVKAPSRAEQLRLLTRQCLTGTALAACRHLTSLDDVFERLKDNFGNVSDLFFCRVEEIRKLGCCEGSNDKKRKWAVAVRSQLTYLRDLSIKHGMYEDLYTHSIITEIQQSLARKELISFVEDNRKLYGQRVPKQRLFELLLEYMDEVVAIYNHNHTYKLDHGVDLDKSRQKVEPVRKPQVSPTPRPSGKKAYISTAAPPPAAPQPAVRKSLSKQKNGTKISINYTAPEMKACCQCNGQHTHVFYCEKYYSSNILVDRVKIVQSLRSCFRCLRMDACLDFNDRVRWQKDHAANCQSEWTCQIDNCVNRPRERQYHFTLCKWHVDENKKIQGDFIKHLDKNQIGPGVSFFFNSPQYYHIDSSTVNQNVKSKNGLTILDDVNEPSIFMLQNVVVNERNLLLFYDSGCLGSSVSDRAAQILESVCVRQGPTIMNVAGGKTVMLEGGDEQFHLDLVDLNHRATITGLKMPHITTPFPVWFISQAWKQICEEYSNFLPAGEPLPPAPDTIGGVEVDVMIGIRYQKYFPDHICTLPCGLGIFKSKISAPKGQITILGGPHPAWRNSTDMIGYLGARSFFTAEMRALQAEYTTIRHLHHPVQHVPDEPEEDVILDDPLDPDLEFIEECLTQHCDKHGDFDDWIIPVYWNLESSSYGIRHTRSRFAEVENAGSEITYRCVRCRNCSRCRQGESLETSSLKEEYEQYLVEESVRFDPDSGHIIARLPFISDPGTNLHPNRYIAERILESQLKQLSKNNQAKLDVAAAFEKLNSKGYVVCLSDLPIEEKRLVTDAPDPGYFIPWRAVWKETSISTPCRLVFDASSKTPGGESLNNILAKGENRLSKIHNILLQFRSKPSGFTADVRMAYNQIRLDPSCYRYQQFLWKENLDPDQPSTVMIICSLIYGVKPAGNQLSSGFANVAEYCIQNYPEHTAGARALIESSYVDDILRPADSHKDAHAIANSLDFVLSQANLSVKAYTFAGSPPAEEVSTDGIHVGLVGLLWNSEDDTIGIDIKDLYFGKPKRGVRPEVVTGSFKDALKKNFTRRNLLGKVSGVYDPNGLVVPITSRMKLDLHDLCCDNLDWDDQIPESYLEKWLVNLNDIQSLKEVRFRRTIIPPDAASSKISLIVSSDASKNIAISCVHARVPLKSGSFSCQLFTAKSKIVRYETIPRAELRAAVMSASLAHSVKYNIIEQYDSSMYVTDSTIVLHWLSHDERPLDTAVRNAVIEIRRLSDVSQWFHVDGTLNIADLGTRHAYVSDIELGSEWQNGKQWMCLPLDQMPVKTVEEINLSSEDRRLASQEVKTMMTFTTLPDLVPRVSERLRYSNYLLDPNRFGWERSILIIGCVLKFIKNSREKFNPLWFPPAPPAPENLRDLFTTPPSFTSARLILDELDLKRAENYYFHKATMEVQKFSTDKEYKDSFIIRNGIYLYVGRILDSQEVLSPEDTMFDLAPLSFVKPIVDRHSPVGYAVMIHSHESISHHKSATATLRESRSIAFILRGRDLSIEITKVCRRCIKYRSNLIEVEMGKLHQSRLTIAHVFYCCQVDLFGPLIAICEHQHRSSVKVYGVVFKDPASCAVAIYLMQNYTTSAFLQAYTRFSARYGHPSELRIDEGSQLMSACNKMEISIVDLSNQIISHHTGIKFTTCPVGMHNAHGMVERSIREIKKLLNSVYGGLKLDIMSIETALAWISSELNNLPICLGSKVDNLDHLDLITPSRLILGRNNRRAAGGFARISSPSRLIDQLDKIYEVWWNVWRNEKLVDFIPQPSKWKITNEQLKEGDIVVYLKSDLEKRFGEPVWKIARVVSVETSEDGMARVATLEYRNPNEKKFRTTRRSVRTVVVVHRETDLDIFQSLEAAARDAAQFCETSEDPETK